MANKILKGQVSAKKKGKNKKRKGMHPASHATNC